MSNDKSGKIIVIRDALLRSEKYFKKHFEVIIDLDVTSPLRSNNDIKNSFNKFIDTNSEILFSFRYTLFGWDFLAIHNDGIGNALWDWVPGYSTGGSISDFYLIVIARNCSSQ